MYIKPALEVFEAEVEQAILDLSSGSFTGEGSGIGGNLPPGMELD